MSPVSSITIINRRPVAHNPQSQRGQDQSSKSSGSKAGPSADSVPDPDQDMTTATKTATEETKRKMYSSVLLIGGGFMFNGAAPALQSRLQAKLPASHRKLVDQVEVIARPKEMDPRTICWKGGAVLSILDSAQELWISQREWISIGVRVLRERSPFIWTICS
ncbi:Actin- protein 8 [Desmophyllum pertusum]|uniref:Actin- protein 8 n=1 Tax=Desmophyllum pertusum TaxID=174260 RepID=A0A9X0D2M8_9CNID|nr:Actin- protein 8 [Desmophyllum pertusum]